MAKMINSFSEEFSFLSNFDNQHEPIKDIDFPEITYPTVEHAFQAAKTLDRQERLNISKQPTPGKAKRAGRAVALRTDWEQIKISIMKHYLKEKFSQPKMRKLLLDTENDTLVEGNTWHDNFWGNCYCSKCKNTIGYNHLGQLLIQVRQEIKGE